MNFQTEVFNPVEFTSAMNQQTTLISCVNIDQFSSHVENCLLTPETVLQFTQADQLLFSYAFYSDLNRYYSPSLKIFIPGSLSGKSIVFYGEPFGVKENMKEFLLQLTDYCRHAKRNPVFCDVDAEFKNLAESIGFTALPIGMDGIVDLSRLSFRGRNGKAIRYALNRSRREKWRFHVYPTGSAVNFQTSLEKVHQSWIASKSIGELRFGLGSFDILYMQQFSLAVVEQGSEILAFGIILSDNSRRRLTIDVYRYLSDSVNGLTDYFYSRLFAYAEELGYQEFSFRLSPLFFDSSIQLTPLWSTAALLLKKIAGYWYPFERIIHFKRKYIHSWEPKFLLCRSRSRIPLSLFDTAILLSGGWREMMKNAQNIVTGSAFNRLSENRF